MAEQSKQKTSRGQSFASFVIERMKSDTGFGAALRRADNPATEYQSWEHLAPWCDIEKAWERSAFAVIAASLARVKLQSDGAEGIGHAIAASYEDGNKSDAAKAKLRRLLACTNTEEACTILRPLLSLVASRGVKVNHGLLLDQLLYYGEKTRVRWAADFYGRRVDDDSDNV